MQVTFKTGLDFSAMDLRSSIAALVATVVRELGVGAKAVADAIKEEMMASFMVSD